MWHSRMYTGSVDLAFLLSATTNMVGPGAFCTRICRAKARSVALLVAFVAQDRQELLTSLYGVRTFPEGAKWCKCAIAIFRIWAISEEMARLVALVAH